jgi:predicted nuclease of predicted toxin-antitoxin system
MPPKLHLNENLSPRLAEQLRQHGFDVTATAEKDMIETDDDTQLAFAASERRAIVTLNHKDFAVLHAEYIGAGRDHWGIVLSTEEPMNVMRHRLLKLLNTLTADNLKNQVRWLNEFK